MKAIELKQLKSGIESFAEGKQNINLDRISMKEFLKILDAWANKYEEHEQQEYYRNLFKRKPYLKTKTLTKYYRELLYIEDTIHKALIDYPDFDGIDFCDVSAGGVYIRGFHKKVNHYTYGSQIKIDYEFDNYINCITMFVDMWKEIDTPEKIKSYNDFLDQGNKHGWD